MLKVKWLFRFFVFLVLVSHPAWSKYQVSNGELRTIERFSSEYIAPRNVHIWLPEGYDKNTKVGVKYAVLYMHDGQMLFDGNQSWNKQEWGVDEVASLLISDSKVRPFIVVGVDNGDHRRHSEYFPQKPFEALPDNIQQSLYETQRPDGRSLFSGEKVQSDNYLKFLVNELKPYIDEHYQVLTGPENTAVMGSSMGGLISMYAISEYPEVFGKAACLSTHWPGAFSSEDNPIPEAFFNYMAQSLPPADSHRLYFDHGTTTLDAMYPELQKRADKVLQQKGFGKKQWQTLVFEGAAHTENAWRARLDIPLRFLFASPTN